METTTTLLHSTIRLTTFASLNRSTSKPLKSPLLLPSPLFRFNFKRFPSSVKFRELNCVVEAHIHDHHHDHHHDDHHSHGHGHHHHHGCGNGGSEELTGPQRAVIEFAKATRWMDLANFLREHLQLCCCAAAMFLAAAVCPYLVPKPAVKPLQNAFVYVAFPLVGVHVLIFFF